MRVARNRRVTGMEQYGSTATYNMESVLRKNVMDSEYFRDTCLKLSSWQEVVDEIFYTVKDVEPWMSGNARGASSAFCLLYRSVRFRADKRGARPRECVVVYQGADNCFARVLGCMEHCLPWSSDVLRVCGSACFEQLWKSSLCT